MESEDLLQHKHIYILPITAPESVYSLRYITILNVKKSHMMSIYIVLIDLLRHWDDT